MHLYQLLSAEVNKWREAGYPNEDYSVISEILEFAANPEGSGFVLRAPQIRALETYWYLRLVQGTPHITDLYRTMYTRNSELLEALGINHSDLNDYVIDNGLDSLLEKVKTDNEFVKQYRLEGLQESLSLDYPSYILALAMGAGKTKLIGAIFASEFAMAMEYPGGPFVQNALVFAPGLTILESLRELADTDYDRILPPRLYKHFAASVKITFTRDGQREIPVIPGSLFNVIVSNTGKIRITSQTVLKSYLGPMLPGMDEETAKRDVANQRLQRIASLPNLAIFSDEAHHTYGNPMTDIKKVRQTVDYLAEKTDVVCVVNTTGTPYYRNQMLKDVVVWYGLSEGIRDGILKELAGSIQSFSFEGNIEKFISHAIEDFFRDYGDVTLPDGTPAKLAIFLPQTDDVAEIRPYIDAKLVQMGLSPTLVLEHHTANEHKEEFDRFKTRSSPHRIALLVNRGVEGWDVPALFACVLARHLQSRNNFVLQAASRCLRQIPGNTHPARVYLSTENQPILDSQLGAVYGESIDTLNLTQSNTRPVILILRKLDIPDLVVRQIVRRVYRKMDVSNEITLSEPQLSPETLTKRVFTLSEHSAGQRVLNQMGEAIQIETQPDTIDLYSASVELSAAYHLDIWQVYDNLKQISGGSHEIPLAYLEPLAAQIEEQTRSYEVDEEVRERALALINLAGFDKEEIDGAAVYTTEINFPVDKQHLLVAWHDMQQYPDLSFHYSPYNFDSQPEKDFLNRMLQHLDTQPHDVKEIYFTGALSDRKKTDFYVEYQGEDGRMHAYTPDFIIRRKDGRVLIVEIKSAQFRNATQEDIRRAEEGQSAITVEGRKAVAARRWQELNKDSIKYEIYYANGALAYDEIESARAFTEDEA